MQITVLSENFIAQEYIKIYSTVHAPSVYMPSCLFQFDSFRAYFRVGGERAAGPTEDDQPCLQPRHEGDHAVHQRH